MLLRPLALVDLLVTFWEQGLVLSLSTGKKQLLQNAHQVAKDTEISRGFLSFVEFIHFCVSFWANYGLHLPLLDFLSFHTTTICYQAWTARHYTTVNLLPSRQQGLSRERTLEQKLLVSLLAHGGSVNLRICSSGITSYILQIPKGGFEPGASLWKLMQLFSSLAVSSDSQVLELLTFALFGWGPPSPAQCSVGPESARLPSGIWTDRFLTNKDNKSLCRLTRCYHCYLH